MDPLVRPSVTRSIVRKHSFLLKKQLGQNFLIDEQVLDQIIEAADLKKDSGAFEIGPGIGTLTQALCNAAGHVLTVEKDKTLQTVLRETLAPYLNLEIIWGDVLDLNLRELLAQRFGERRVSVVANLPYYITTPIVMKLLEERLPLSSIVVMVQKEVADRITASPGGKDYGVLSVAVQYYAQTDVVCRVRPNSFFPPPTVDSSVVRMRIRQSPAVMVDDEPFFFDMVKASFAQRRKTLHNNLSHRFSGIMDKAAVKSFIEQAGIDPGRRGETLSLEEFARLADIFKPR